MKIAIQPVQLFVPGKGTITANLLEVRAFIDLQVSAYGFYDVQRRTVTPAVPEVPAALDGEGNIVTPAVPAVPEQIVDESLGSSGNCSLTPEQFAAWGQDDAYFARCIAQNLGLTPA